MHRYKAAALLLLALDASHPAAAQPAPAPPPVVQPDTEAGRCATLLTRITPLLSGATRPEIAASGPDSCTIRNAEIRFGGRFGFSVGSIVVQGMTPAVPPTGPIHRRVEVRDAISVAHTGRAAFDWMFRQQQFPIQLVFDATEDPAAHTVTVKELSVSGEDLGAVSVDGVIERLGPDVPQIAGLPDPSSAAIRTAHLHGDSKRFVLRYILPAYVGMMETRGTMQTDDPDSEVAADKARAVAMVGSLLAMTQAVPGTAEAISAFIDDLPKPAHVLDLTVDASAHPVGMSDTGILLEPTVLHDMKVRATYEGASR